MSKPELCGGIDEAGRGPVIGPLIIGCVVLDGEGREKLRDLKVRDSKRVSPKRRAVLELEIKECAVEWGLIEISPVEIDVLRKRHSLNAIEAMKVAEIILSLEMVPEVIYVDAVDNVAEHYKKRVLNHLTSLNNEFIIPEIVSEHKADDRYIEVSSASILAKVERDRIVDCLKEGYGDFGSGYPSDDRTSKFIREIIQRGEIPEFVRRSWNTLEKKKQMKLGEF